MKNLQNAFEKLVSEKLSFAEVSLFYIKRELRKIEITLTIEQEEALLLQFKNKDIDRLHVVFEDEQIEAANLNEDTFKELFEEILAFNETKMEELEIAIGDILQTVVNKSVYSITRSLFKELQSELESNSQERNKEAIEIERLLCEDYRSIFLRIEAMISISKEVSFDIIEHPDENDIQQCPPSKFTVLSRLQKRMCQISDEVLLLIKKGYLTGALARWRSLHEVNIVLIILSKGNEELSQRYLDHFWISEYKEFLLYKEYCAYFNIELPQEKIDAEVSKRKDEMIEKYGKSFNEDFGWAYSIFDTKKITFRDLELKAEMEQARFDYKLSSNAIHAGIKGIADNPFLAHDHEIDYGSAVTNMTLPLSLLSKSILSATSNFLTNFPILDNILAMKLMLLFHKSIYKIMNKL